ncbi:MAG: lipopolysaccharide transport periplasmic protein LptA [Pseudomonadota bacterium]|nr:lipopolysaccharide transport periplasmic protein LptA [Pseudomonadota bacterium]
MARSSDRNQPMNIQADTTTYNANSANTPTVVSGNVVITQGTLKIDASRAEVYENRGDISRTVLTGSPVRMSQQMDDGTPMNVTATRIDYDMKTEIVTLTGNVVLTQPRANMRGERVVYNMRTGQVQSGGQGQGRVNMTIQPRTGGN